MNDEPTDRSIKQQTAIIDKYRSCNPTLRYIVVRKAVCFPGMNRSMNSHSDVSCKASRNEFVR